MRVALFFAIIFLISCSDQGGKNQQAQLDTAKLLDPNPQPGDLGASEMKMFKRAIALFEPGYTVVLNDQHNSFNSLAEVSRFIDLNKEEIKKEKFYIITDNTTAFKKVLATIDLLAKSEISNYKVINTDTYFAPPEAVQIESPTVTTKIINTDSFFTIHVQKKGLKVTLTGKDTLLNNTNELDAFIAANKPKDDATHKIIISYSETLPSERFKSVMDVLKKHNYLRFSLSHSN